MDLLMNKILTSSNVASYGTSVKDRWLDFLMETSTGLFPGEAGKNQEATDSKDYWGLWTPREEINRALTNRQLHAWGGRVEQISRISAETRGRISSGDLINGPRWWRRSCRTSYLSSVRLRAKLVQSIASFIAARILYSSAFNFIISLALRDIY